MDYDFLVIGGGSAGFNAARVAAGLGRRTAIVDGARELGGLCILRGCMPSKTLLYPAEILHRAQHGAALGLRIRGAKVDMRALHARKERIIADFAGHRQRALTGGAFDLIRNRARLEGPDRVVLDDGRRLTARAILVATGSAPAVPAAVRGLAEARAWTSDDVLDLDFVPPSVIVLGGGVVACELAQLLRRIGSRVVLVQRSPDLLREHSAEAAAVVRRSFEDEGIEVFTGTALDSVTRDRRGFTVAFRQGGRLVRRRAAHCLNALGRVPSVGGLGLEAAGVRTNASGKIATNRWQQTSVPRIYAAGDCAGPAEIVHVAIQQGELAARHAAGVPGLKPVDYAMLLGVVFTDPPLATVGRGARQLEAAGVPFLSASYPFDDHGKSILMDATRGYVKVMADPVRGRILGAEIVGQDAGELIHCFTGPMAMRATVRDMLRAPWYHPTLAEILTYPLEEIADRLP